MIRQLLITIEGNEEDVNEAQDSITAECSNIEGHSFDFGGTVNIDVDSGEGYRWMA